MEKVLRPKVLGAIHLDEIFHDNSLDFFILFSSVTAIAGNRASILHIGAVMGVGYINRGFSDAIFAALHKTGFMMMSEREFHLCFGEAVVASHPLSNRNPEVITALETIRSTEVQPPWAKFPRFQHCIQIEEAGDKKTKKKTATISTKARLLEVTTPAEVFEVVSEAFFQKLQLALHLPSETERSQVMASGLDDLGVDSLKIANSIIMVAIDGKIRLDSLETAVRTIDARHEAFRTSFFTGEDQKPVQGISPRSRLFLEKKVIETESQVNEEFERLKNYVYDIEHGECMRLIHLSLTPTKSYLLIGSHHIILDGISLEIILNDLQRAYNGQSLPQDLRQEISSGTLPLLPFATCKSRTSLTGYSHTSIEKTCARLKANMFHFYLGVFEVLLFKLLGTSDICIGMADANCWDNRVAESIGMYLNLLPLRFHLDNTENFETVLKETRRKAYLAMSHSRLSFDVPLENIKCERSRAFSPLFQAFINYRQGVSETRQFDGAKGTTEEISLPRAGYVISLDIIENPGHDTKVIFMLQESIYSEADTTRILDLYLKLLGSVCEFSGQPLNDILLFSQSEIEKAVKLGQGPVLVSSWPETLPDRVHNIAAKYPASIDIKEPFSGEAWTYEQLPGEVNRISSALLASDVTKGSVVAVFQDPSAQLVFSLFAILSIGAIYVSLDNNFPAARLQAMLEQCKPSAVLANSRTTSKSYELGLASSVVLLNVSQLADANESVREVRVSAHDPAAILFTSGTTGIPKGVILSHGNLRNHLALLTVTHGFRIETVLQQSSVGFDMSLNQIFIALCNGGTLVIHDITYTSATPSEYLAWYRHGSDSLTKSMTWMLATAGGEQFSSELADAFRQLKGQLKHSLRMFNTYGPTECFFSSNEREVNLDILPVTTGAALPNYAVCIIDQDLLPLPVDFPGEICISGAGVTIGYLNNPQETARKFIKTSFSNKAYRTGDKGILHGDGTLEVLGRIDGDTQVKLRGLRIELQDIEQSIMKTAKGQIKEVVVTACGNSTALIAHAVVSSAVPSQNTQQFLEFILSSLPLPQYMHPSAMIPIDRIPLTSSGKVGRNSLKALPVTSWTETEQFLAQIWESTVPRVGLINPTSDFFHVGGNSMLLIELRNLITHNFGVTLPLTQLFEHSTLTAMASIITSSATLPQSSESINWAVESSIPPSFKFLLPTNSSATAPSHTPRNILLTGATGFLGQNLLHSFLSNPSIQQVHALAVRDPSKLSSHPKLTIHPGDLSQPLLGISKPDFDQLAETVDAIIHNGAEVSFLKNYFSLRAPNVSSTKTLVELAVPRRIPIHFVSTGTVSKFAGGEEVRPESLAAFLPTGKDVYAATKWVSEVYLENVAREFKVPVVVHRSSSVLGQEVVEGDMVGSVMKYAKLIKAVPESKG
ncbi:hypothetical protein QBC38DRAFT_508775 [Podospora fimiseda]|uniref:Carrier domain-containing protein n=1 Tax=Podospora fimiseda TaxID=252190 RepID=A0AAN7BSJ9_9PEZI|nr:hypothetical protein QBC38DRAFT_508775 [Podospora fimiseda]